MILDHVRFRVFLESLDRDDTYVLAAVSESDRGLSVHKLLASELRQVLALPEVMRHFGLLPSQYLATRVAELQAIVDKREATRSGVDVALGVCEELVKERGATAEALWQLLDDIDTLSDSIKPDTHERYERFYRRALEIAKRRHLFLKSDGYTLTWPSGDKVPRGAQQVVPEPIKKSYVAPLEPVPMLLHCPMCHTRHIDEGEFATKPHHTHACQNRKCGHVWRPAIVSTVGVWTLPGFLNDPKAAEGDALVGKRARMVAGGFEGTIKSYASAENSYLLGNNSEQRLLSRHEFLVLE